VVLRLVVPESLRSGAVLSVEQQQLVIDRVGLATALAHKEWCKLNGYERDEVISWALNGLVLAAVRWPDYCREHDYEMYTPTALSWFSTYATRRIIGAIIDELRSSDPATRAERALVKEIGLKGVDLYVSWDYDSPQSISSRTGISVEDVNRALSALLRVPVPLDDYEEAEQIVVPLDVEGTALRSALCAEVVSAVRALPPLHRCVLVLSCYYQLSDSKVAQAIPEISRDPVASRWSGMWIQVLREEAQDILRKSLRSVLDLPLAG
jgi:RNA polymerase sigma factor for flagellar operon FliA